MSLCMFKSVLDLHVLVWTGSTIWTVSMEK